MQALSPNSVLFFIAASGLASVALFDTSHYPATAQTPTQQRPEGVRIMSQVKVLFVNPSIGDDRATGGESDPLKTITKALQVANTNTVIMLSQGTYSTQTGEIFPLMLKPGVSIQGEPKSKGRGIILLGGGEYLSRTFGRQNVTLIGANQAGLSGVTVTNPNSRGYGLWIEYSSPVVAENTFTGSTQDGIAVNGDGTPMIGQNYFYRNGANGITIGGNSQPQVRENVFQQTGFAINITQNAQPLVVGNSIQENRSGIIVQASSRPILRSNRIQDNKEDGLVALAQSSPDLGNAKEPGGNEFRNNARYDINASAAKQAIAAYGNTLVSSRIAGKVDINGTIAIAQNSQPSAVASKNLPASVNNHSITRQINQQLQPLNRVSLPQSVANVNEKPLSSQSAGFATSTSSARYKKRQVPATVKTPSTPQLNYVQISPSTSSNIIEFAAPQSTSSGLEPRQESLLQQPNAVASAPVQTNLPQSLPVLQPAPVGAEALLPVPNSTVPIGYTGNISKVPTPRTAFREDSRSSSPLPRQVAQIDLRYRVIVDAENEQQQQLVKFMAPGAFHTVWHGKEVMQVGVFSTRAHADNIVRMLNNKGLKAVVEPIN